MTDQIVSEKSKAASLLGRIKSLKKTISSRKNGKDQKPHLMKTKYFVSIFPHKLVDNNWHKKFPMKIDGKHTTYNPDYRCDELDCWIELCTSKPNMSEQGCKWAEMIRQGHKLRVFWWEGNEITDEVVSRYTREKE
jgi:hypothetical protein